MISSTACCSGARLCDVMEQTCSCSNLLLYIWEGLSCAEFEVLVCAREASAEFFRPANSSDTCCCGAISPHRYFLCTPDGISAWEQAGFAAVEELDVVVTFYCRVFLPVVLALGLHFLFFSLFSRGSRWQM